MTNHYLGAKCTVNGLEGRYNYSTFEAQGHGYPKKPIEQSYYITIQGCAGKVKWALSHHDSIKSLPDCKITTNDPKIFAIIDAHNDEVAQALKRATMGRAC